MLDDGALYDIAVVGGGPAGVAAAIWGARYRRRVVLIDAGEHRNRWTSEAHGYLGLDGIAPAAMLQRARDDLDRYREVHVRDRRHVVAASQARDRFVLRLDDGSAIEALRLVIATGVRDIFPDVDGFDGYFGQSIFTCPSCDGYEAQGKAVAVVGDSAEMAEFALSLLDWAGSVVAVRESEATSELTDRAREQLPVRDVIGRVTAIEGQHGQVTSLELDSGATVPCEVVFWLMRHEQQSDLPAQLGCALTGEGCVVVDDDCETTTRHVYAAGDITPGPHLVQIAAAKGARAGIASAVSLRGESGAPLSPAPAPDPEPLTDAPDA